MPITRWFWVAWWAAPLPVYDHFIFHCSVYIGLSRPFVLLIVNIFVVRYIIFTIYVIILSSLIPLNIIYTSIDAYQA